MFTIAFNNIEKQKLLEILRAKNSPESQEFIRRINNCQGFYGNDENGKFNFSEYFVKPTYSLIDNGNKPSGIKFN